MDYSYYDIYINEKKIEGSKPKISEEQKNEWLDIGKYSICKIQLSDINLGNDFFVKLILMKKIWYTKKKGKIISKEQIKNLAELKIKYKGKNIIIKNQNKDLNIEKYNCIEINNEQIKEFFKIEGNFNLNYQDIKKK